MAVRNIVIRGDQVLAKRAKEVDEINDHVRMILDDMLDTLHEQKGIGIAAPQVGIMRRMFIVELDDHLYELINPEFVAQEGTQFEEEACLSVPGYAGKVERPAYVKIKGLDRSGQPVEYEGRDLLAAAFCHEYDHLDGILYIDKAVDVRKMDEEPEEME